MSLHATQNYVYSVRDVLGQGATGSVYKARHKQSGELYAVKVFTQVSNPKYLSVQMRELDILQKLDHPNIVKFFAVETEVHSACRVLVMELCSGGSLHSLLEKPANNFGVAESDFMNILADISGGLEKLRDDGIIHRDIKPGNIMCAKAPDGSTIYKLIDFGAARELKEEENFMSLYGTEEYLHPHLYKQAVLRQPSDHAFNISADLWSLGVTLYHICTGHIPFKPYGGRKNKELMHKITTDKKSGVISGIQHTDRGEVVYSKTLPVECRMSDGARELITPILAGLMESDSRKQWSFQDFFREVKEIRKRVVMHVFSARNSQIHILYMHPQELLPALQKKLEMVVRMKVSDQLLLYGGHSLDHLSNTHQRLQAYPVTTQQQPMYLFQVKTLDFVELEDPQTPKMPQVFQTMSTLDSDHLMSKQCLAVFFWYQRYVSQSYNIAVLSNRSVVLYHEHICTIICELTQTMENYGYQLRELLKRDDNIISTAHSTVKMLHIAMRHIPDQPGQRLAAKVQEAFDIVEVDKTSERARSLQDTKATYDNLQKTVRSYVERIHQCRELMQKWKDNVAVDKLESTLSHSEMLSSDCEEIYKAFRQDRHQRKLSYNDEQIHRFDKQKLESLCDKNTSVMTTTLDLIKSLHSRVDEWFRMALKVLERLYRIKTQLTSLREKMRSISGQTDDLKRRLDTQFESIRKMWKKDGVMTEGKANSENSSLQNDDGVSQNMLLTTPMTATTHPSNDHITDPMSSLYSDDMNSSLDHTEQLMNELLQSMTTSETMVR